ncbi:NAD(P)H-dependent oxidoreductase [Fusarium sp. NRRL 52700]|nr:NAD(P)H-dependent oxidoreductase [Fusarium sp. NRRL 52700]
MHSSRYQFAGRAQVSLYFAGVNLAAYLDLLLEDITEMARGRQSIGDLTGPDKAEAWGQALTKYTESDLTFEKDRLVAIAGLAKVIASRTGGTYLAGIWLESWMQDLLWKPDLSWVPVQGRKPNSEMKAENITMIPPSWSWLGFFGSVRPRGEGPKISIVTPNAFESDEYQPLALLSQTVVIPTESDPFTFFERAILRVRCLLLPVTFAGGDERTWYFRPDYDIRIFSLGLDCLRLRACGTYGDKDMISFTLHFSKSLDKSLQYFLLPLYIYQYRSRGFLDGQSCVYGLVLQKGLREGTEEYTRVGSWEDDYRFSSQLSPIISNTIIKLGVGEISTLRDGSLSENERIFDSKLREYAAGHVASEVLFPMPGVKKAMQYPPDTEEVDKKNEADKDAVPSFRDKRVKCSLLPHFTTAEWATISITMATHHAKNEALKAAALFDVSHITAVVTGGATGIGLMITQALQSNGAKVYITGRRTEVLEQTQKTYGTGPGSIHVLPGDVSEKDEAIRLAEEVGKKEPNGIHLLVNNAGIAEDDNTKFSSVGEPDTTDAKALSEHFLKTEPHQWADTLKTNVTGPYYMSMAFLPLLAKGRETTPGYSSQIVNVSSISGAMKGSSMGQPAYATSKAALTHLSRMIATLTKDVKVRVNVIAPGLFPSEMTTGESDERNKSNIDKKMTNPAGRPGHDTDMAATILFLAGKGGLFYNGQIVYPDGGSTLINPAIAN